MKIGLVLRELHRSEADLAHELLQARERHRADHELHHVAQDLAEWSSRHVREIAEVAGPYGEELDPEAGRDTGLARAVRDRASELLGRSSAPGLLLLRDLRTIYTKASGVTVDWDMLGQAAQAVRHTDLLDVVQRCFPETRRQARWAEAKLKESSTQVLVS
ncbi:hypothetical protein [Cellulosimicrobium sp. 22601]|uniref:hypothetical protein n=1 Tax=unclassified Cellulosimicrobium TaxID=2624466 RepID=UPI003F82BD2B